MSARKGSQLAERLRAAERRATIAEEIMTAEVRQREILERRVADLTRPPDSAPRVAMTIHINGGTVAFNGTGHSGR